MCLVTAAGQAQKHVTHNEALMALDALVQLSVQGAGGNAPPASPAEGERHIVGDSASAAWAGHARAVALWLDGAWQFHPPRAGWLAWRHSGGDMLVFDGTAWQPLGHALASLSQLQRIGIGTAADPAHVLTAVGESQRLAARPPAAGGTGDVRQYLSKEQAGNTASLIFQTASSGRAEMGLAGNDDFAIKVSADGGTWREALGINASSGELTSLGQDVWRTGGVASRLQAQAVSVIGGGTIRFLTAGGRNRLAWSSRFRVVSAGAHPLSGALATDILCPASGSVAVHGTALTESVTADGVPLEPFDALCFDLRQQQLVIVRASVGAVVLPPEFAVLARHDGDAGRVLLAGGRSVALGQVLQGFNVASSAARLDGFEASSVGTGSTICLRGPGGEIIGSDSLAVWARDTPVAAIVYATGGKMRVYMGGDLFHASLPAFAPALDNGQTLGQASARWSTIFAANGVIQTSDARDKVVLGPLGASATRLVDEVAPVLFRWRDGGQVEEPEGAAPEQPQRQARPGAPLPALRPRRGRARPGKRQHAGFLAQDIRRAMDGAGVDFACWGLDDAADRESRQWLRPDQLVPVLWAALRDTRAEVNALRRRLEG
jgi:hypothetical protein